jgi:hypothetical protein
MSKPLRISVSNVSTLGSGYDAMSNDEISIFGYAITSAGVRYLIKPVNLGSYGEGEDRSFEANPIVLLDEEVSDAVDICAICLFLIERDYEEDVVSFANGSLALFNTSWEEARQNLDTTMSTRERNLFAFSQSMIQMAYHTARVNDWGDSDETYPPEFRIIPAALGPGAPGEDGRYLVVRFNGNGFYNITLKYVFNLKLLVHP